MSGPALKITSCQAPNADADCRAIAAYLGRRLGLSARFVDDVPWQERERLLDAGEIAAGWICGLPYVRKADAPAPSVELLPNLLNIVVSFVILGMYWVGHHTQFEFIKRGNQTLLWLNIVFLTCVSLIPFSAGILGRHGAQQIAVVIYGLNLIVVALSHYAMWRYATNGHRLVAEDIDPNVVGVGAPVAAVPGAVRAGAGAFRVRSNLSLAKDTGTCLRLWICRARHK